MSAIRDYSKAIELNPNFSNSYHNRGILYLVAMNNLKSAIEDARKACSLGDCNLFNFMEKQGLIRDLNSTNLSESKRYVNSRNSYYELENYIIIVMIVIRIIKFMFIILLKGWKQLKSLKKLLNLNHIKLLWKQDSKR